jgi:hypothetical protein
MGVDSIRVTTIASQQNPNGLPRNALAWLQNATVRDGGISQRFGWQPLGVIHDSSGLFQGGWMYDPGSANPYLMLSISGNMFKVDIDPGFGTTNVTTGALGNSPTLPQFWFVQAEQFLVVQTGDGVTLPLFWDGTTLRRSIGITNTAATPGQPGQNEIPAATAMDYFMGRLWYAQGRNYSGGDIVGGPSGTVAYDLRDAVLNVTENPLVLGGDGFTVPDEAGNIRALKHSANINTQLGEGSLYIFTRKAVYSLAVPVSRADWVAAGNGYSVSPSNQMPLQSVIQLVNGAVNDRSIVSVNGDLFYQSYEPAIRSLITAVRNFQQWGNIDISSNEFRVLQANDRDLMSTASGIEFNNRLLQCVMPKQTPQGVVFQAVIPMDFTPISTLQTNLAPAWEGVYNGLDILQLFTGDFGGRQRAFAVTVNRTTSNIELWEFTDANKYENGDNRVVWQIEFPAFTWGDEFALKKLVSAELWVDRLACEIEFTMDYRPDGETCWLPWHHWKECTPRNTCEQGGLCYPDINYGPSYRATMTLPVPPVVCELASSRPSNIAYQFQTRLTVKGYCRIRGLLVHAAPVERKLYEGKVC